MAGKREFTSRVSSPASTGGAGTFFEQHVGAHWLSLLLTRAIPPIICDCAVSEVHFQTERLGYSTDDFLVVGENSSGARRKLLGQVKRSFTVSSADEECTKAILDYWRDFNRETHFSREFDRFALVTLRGTNTLLENLSSLLDCARAARDPSEFEQRLGTPGLINATARKYGEELKAIVAGLEGLEPSDAEMWPFLRVLSVLSLDLNTTTRQTEAWIKSLLAHTAADHDPLGVAESTWHALLAAAGEGMPEARSYTRGDLPSAALARHSCIETRDRRALAALKDHSSFVLKQTRSTIGDDLHLPRVGVVQQIIDKLASSRVVLVSGPAGSGKSGVAKSAVEFFAPDHLVFAFRAEEFEHASLDETLHLAQIPTSAKALGAVLAGQDRKLVLVESIERLFESSTRDAFSDLLSLLADDGSWRLLLTCREYSTDLVRSSLLDLARVSHSVVSVPPLDDGELSAVAVAFPGLSRPLANPALRQLLRNPYFVDKARLIAWDVAKPLPESEREFRTLFWRDIIRVEHRAGAGMPSRRERAFVEVSLRRARALSLFAPCSDLDQAALDSLRSSSLIARSEKSIHHHAPAHDVLEDWAILHWMDDQHAASEGSLSSLATAMGSFPAIRRSYRKWVGELVDRDPEAADILFVSTLDRTSLPNYVRDDTLVAFLRSNGAESFLDRHRDSHFAAGKEYLRRLIHLLRVACVTGPAYLGEVPDGAAFLSVPDGPAWAAVLGLVRARLDTFGRDDSPLLLGLVEDWSGCVSGYAPYPEGAEHAVRIAFELLPRFEDYSSDDDRKRVLRVIAKLPKVDEGRFEALITRERGPKRERAAEDFREIVLEGVEGLPACRDVPEIVVAAAEQHFLLTEADLKERDRFGDSMNLEPLFGIQEARHHDFYPPSALRGPFLPLLRHHPRLGVDFVLSLFNRSTEWYVGRKAFHERIEPPWEVRVRFSDESTRSQWCNPRLWDLYRGTSVGPYLLQCALMAVELWLFEVAESHPKYLDSWLTLILKGSDSAAISAVVASLAIAHPHHAGEALLALLGTKEYVLLDRGRLTSELQAQTLADLVPYGDAMNRIYSGERNRANARPHRRQDLEAAAINLQFGPFAPRVSSILDRHLSELPAIDLQREHDRIWRIALARMDLRHYTFEEREEEATQSEDAEESARKQYILNLRVPDADLVEMSSESAARFASMNRRLALEMWGIKVLERAEPDSYDPAQWRVRLEQSIVSEPEEEGDDAFRAGRHGPGLVAAVCARDHWDELSDEEKLWSLDRVCREVELHADVWDRMSRVQRYSKSSDRVGARVLPTLLGRTLPEGLRGRVTRVIAVALTHPIAEVRWHAARGIGAHLWSSDRAMALRCVNALATQATLAQVARDEEFKKPYRERADLDQLERGIANALRNDLLDPHGIPSDALARLDPSRSVAAEAYGPILCILSKAPAETLAIEEFKRAARILAGWWDAGDIRRGDRQRERNYETESAITDLLQEFVFDVAAPEVETILDPLITAVDEHPRGVSGFLLGITAVEDRRRTIDRFWMMWQLFANRVPRAGWLPSVDNRYSEERELLTTVFLGAYWKDDVRHWRSLEGNAWRVHSLFDSLPSSPAVFEAYLRFLYHIGEQALPDAFVRLAKRLVHDDAGRILSTKNSIYMLESLLRRHVYGRPLELKRRPELRSATLHLLDVLVERGSSAAFRMRDDFVTPVAET